MSSPTSTPSRAGTPRSAGTARRSPRGAAGSPARPAARRGVGLGRSSTGGKRPGRGPGGLLPTGRAATTVLCGAVLVAALLLALWINIALSRGSYDQHALESQRTLLAEQEQALDEHLAEVSSAAALDARAQAMGMVRAPDSAWLVLQAPQDQAVVGDPEAATVPTPTPTPTATSGSSASGGTTAGDSPSDDAPDGAGAAPASSDEPSPSGSRSGSSSPSGRPSSTGGAG